MAHSGKLIQPGNRARQAGDRKMFFSRDTHENPLTFVDTMCYVSQGCPMVGNNAKDSEMIRLTTTKFRFVPGEVCKIYDHKIIYLNAKIFRRIRAVARPHGRIWLDQ